MATPVTVVVTQATPAVAKVDINVAQSGNVALVKVQLPGLQGPQGAQGIPGTGQGITLSAAAAVNAFTIVRDAGNGQVCMASSSNLDDAGEALGLATNNAAAGGDVVIQSSGLVTDPSWAFVPGPVFLGANGSLTQTEPSTGFLQQVATAVSPTQLVVALKPAIILS